MNVFFPTKAIILIINIYNAPVGSAGEGSAVRALTFFFISNFFLSVFIRGGFNLYYSRWEPSFQRSTARAKPFFAWADQHSICLISEPDLSTHKGGHVLDLAFASGPLVLAGTKSSVATQLYVASDHLLFLSLIPWDKRFQEPQAKLRPSTFQQDIFISLLKANLKELSGLTPDPDSLALDRFAEGLTKAIQYAYQGSAKRSLSKGSGQPWWDNECKNAAQKYHTARREVAADQLYIYKRALRKATRTAKRRFYLSKLDAASSGADVFEMTKWHKTTGSFRSPPLKDPTDPEAPPATTLMAKREILIKNLLQNTAEADDIPLDSPTVPSRALHFPDITDAEISKAILSVSSTAPGEDEITTAVLKAGWFLIRDSISLLYRACLTTGYHPLCFRRAIVAIMGKPNKPDRSSPRAYRPIALLSVLGKGLERLIARRMSWIAVKFKVFPKQQFGALPFRLAMDLTTCLTHDVESALNQNLTASLLTTDIKGAFDRVLPGRLVQRLREQGWPTILIFWIASFITDHKIKIRLDGTIGPTTGIKCGLPQGSPVSPILFMLYVAPLLRLGKLRRRFGYADDFALLAITPTLENNTTLLIQDLHELLDWGSSEGITFDSGKTELLHFSRRHADSDPTTTPIVSAGSFTIAESLSRPYLRWLGVLFDKKLTFKWHVRTQAGKAIKVSKALASLGNTVRGVPPSLLRRAVIACVLPIAYFAAETWWPGRTRQGPSAPISNRADTLLNILSKVVLIAARAILPVYRTTPTGVLHRESGLPPPEITLNAQALAATICIRRLDTRHPLFGRAKELLALDRPISCFARRVLALPCSEYLDPIHLPPWQLQETREAASARIGAPRGVSKEQYARLFTDFSSHIPSGDITVFSDGSKLSDGATGAGFVAF